MENSRENNGEVNMKNENNDSEKDLNYTKEKNEDYLDALATITLLVSESQIEHIKRAKSSGETWKALECAHGKNSLRTLEESDVALHPKQEQILRICDLNDIYEKKQE
ncbi:hypothetical protein O9G_004323 [Rozella allomycis CSF55]|uniref:Uncharacterized protein n=1 Tax=Rozella allomycis (strain CSF55) TaxID=988480 RepID=A0A075AZT5_ROZAC|nr:hypothetical protein O9G_004323 [Rozella allomycis CSF55]|eukprot:EPZ34207.1 hypothetical protein O9G_004323 [Rozella allomycis CSF55]